ncbi:protein AMN1 homolog [Ptychodera flava]|uniref:protein AMN1 homolog n=1 Tax=Ptychodera flava TaxID=63121 RepID=UPI00396A0E9A
MAAMTYVNCSSVPTLFTSSLQFVVTHLPQYITEVESLPSRVKDRLLNLLSKRGLLTDDNISKVIHDRVKVLDLSECDVTDDGLQAITLCKQLRKLDLNAAKENRTSITTRGVQLVAQSCPILQTVYLRRCLNITDDAVISLSQCCRQLMLLNIGGCRQITDASLEALGKHCRMLKSVNFCKTKVTDDGVISLVTGCCKQSLTEIHMNHCIRVTDESVEAVMECCPRISILLFDGCPLITDRSRQALEELSGPQTHMKQVTWTIY